VEVKDEGIEWGLRDRGNESSFKRKWQARYGHVVLFLSKMKNLWALCRTPESPFWTPKRKKTIKESTDHLLPRCFWPSGSYRSVPFREWPWTFCAIATCKKLGWPRQVIVQRWSCCLLRHITPAIRSVFIQEHVALDIYFYTKVKQAPVSMEHGVKKLFAHR